MNHGNKLGGPVPKVDVFLRQVSTYTNLTDLYWWGSTWIKKTLFAHGHPYVLSLHKTLRYMFCRVFAKFPNQISRKSGKVFWKTFPAFPTDKAGVIFTGVAPIQRNKLRQHRPQIEKYVFVWQPSARLFCYGKNVIDVIYIRAQRPHCHWHLAANPCRDTSTQAS